MPFPFSARLPFTESRRMTSAVLVAALAAIGLAIYLSPGGKDAAATKAQAGGQAPLPTPALTAPAVTTVTQTPTVTPDPSGSGSGGTAVPKTSYSPYKVIHAAPVTDVVIVKVASKHTVTAAPKPVKGVLAVALKGCKGFKWQQDAQAEYLSNLSDPAGLDGAKGPNNGNGIACDQLPPNPSQPVSTPVDAYVAPAPSPGTKASLVRPAAKYFGIAEDGLPGDGTMLDTLDRATGKAPSLLEYFQTMSTGFDASHVTQAWSRGAMPAVTMQTQGAGDDSTVLSDIVLGKWDTYWSRYAADIRATNLPVVLRFDHEMNGNWYAWSAGLPQNQCGYNGAACDSGVSNLYVQAWRHVWQIFHNLGANEDVVWAWTPVRVDGLTTADTGRTCTSSGCRGQTAMTPDYPGDNFVDWVGLSGYAWKIPTSTWHPQNTYAATLTVLRRVSSKPIYIAETGAASSYGGNSTTPLQDTTAAQTQWISEALSYIAAQPDVIGFVYFDNNSVSTHVDDSGQPVDTNWQLEASPQGLAAFKAGIASSAFSFGIMPDSTS